MKGLTKIAIYNAICGHPAMSDPPWHLASDTKRKPKKSKRNPSGKGKKKKTFGKNKR